MARLVTVCSMNTPGVYAGGASGQAAVERMKLYWTNHLAEAAVEKPDLIVLPEACDRFEQFTAQEHAEYYAARGTSMLEFFQQKAADMQCYIAYSTILEDPLDGCLHNSTLLLDRHGAVAGRYNKNYPTIGEMEVSGIVPGSRAECFQCDFGTVGCLICFDLNFDELRQRYAAQKPDLLLFSSMFHGGLKQQLWAYSCQAHFIAAINRPGRPGVIMAPNGRILHESTEYTYTLSCRLNLDCCQVHWDYNSDKFPAMKQKYGRDVEIDDIGHSGSVVIRNYRNDITVNDLIAEFELETVDKYFQRSAKYRNDFLLKL